MALILTINPSFKDRRIAHDRIYKTLGEHTQEELLQLAIHARLSHNPTLLCCFANLPRLDVLTAEKAVQDLAEIAGSPIAPPATGTARTEIAPAAPVTTATTAAYTTAKSDTAGK